MSTRQTKTRSIKVDPDLHKRLAAEAEVRDTPTDPMIEALLLGALVTGDLDRLVTRGIGAAGDDLRRRYSRRRPRRNRRWTMVGGPRQSDGAAMWATDDAEWWLRYRGNARAAGRRRPGEGWHLSRGMIDTDATFVGWARREAIEAAEQIIARAEREEAAT